MRQSPLALRPTAFRAIRFDEPLESEFRADFDRVGRGSRSELWLIMLVVITLVLVFNRVFLDVPPEVLPLGKFLVVGVLVPMVLRWLSGDHSPLHRWSSVLFVASVYIDIGAMMVLRVACVRNGIDVVPLVMPVAVLMSLIVVQIRFALVAPAILLGLLEIVAVELWAFGADSNRLFAITASAGMVVVALAAAYDLERWTRIGWMRQRDLDALARTDPLTGLANRRHFGEVLHAAAERDTALALMILDIDRFKSFNDRFGHPAGDACLRAVGNYLTAAAGSAGFVARLGGEEFAVLWAGGADEQRADGVRSGLSEVELAPIPGVGASITASAGFAQARLAGTDVDAFVGELLSRADAALYDAKRTGRDKLVAFTAHEYRRGRQREGTELDRRLTFADSDPLTFSPRVESAFRESFEAQGRSSRRLIMIGLLGVIAALLVFQGPLLKIPAEADRLGRLTLIFGLTPGALLALVGNSWGRLARWAPQLYIGGVAVIISAQMVERAVQLPLGYDVVPLIMPLAVLLSLTVTQIRFRLLFPAAVVGLVGICAAELLLFPTTSKRLLEVGACVVMVGVTLRFSYKLERSRRIGWSRERRLDELTRLDPLTGLMNRRQFDESLAALIDAAAREGRPVTFMTLDIDHFKAYNDNLGHLAGDECLRVVGQYLDAQARAFGGFAARLGGEEFATAWPGVGDAEPVRRGIADLEIAGISDRGPVTASAGIVVAAVDESPTFAIELQRRADAALYVAKRAGRDQSSIADLQRVE